MLDLRDCSWGEECLHPPRETRDISVVPHSSRRIVRRKALYRRVAGEKSFALRERNRMRRNLRDASKLRPWHSNEIVHNRNHNLGLNVQTACNQQVIRTVYGPGQAVLNRRKNNIRKSTLNTRVERLESRPRNEFNLLAQ